VEVMAAGTGLCLPRWPRPRPARAGEDRMMAAFYAFVM
jgi:hypothetical protein